MKRRAVLGLAVTACVSAGCVELESAAFGADDSDGEGDEGGDEDSPPEGESGILLETLEAIGVDVTGYDEGSTSIDLDVQTSGNLDTDVNQIASGYSSVATDMSKDLSVRVEDRGLTEARLEIEHEWAVDHAEGRKSDQEYLLAIQDTMD